MFQVNTMVLIIMLVLVTYQVHADPTISTSTPTPCYGDEVTLVCHHPEVISNRGRYFTQTPTWRENGTSITVADGTIYTTETVADLTQTFLNINITVDHFRNKSFNYSCVLLLAENGLPTGEVETSGEVTVDPDDLTPPKVTNMDPLESFITVRWTPQPCAVRYRVSWMYTNDDGTTTTGSGVSDQVTNYTIPTSVLGVYTVSVEAVDGVGNVGPATSEVVRSSYPRPTADASPCEDRSLVLTCLVSGQHNDRRSHFMWIDRNGPLDNSYPYSITGDQLMIANVSALSVEEDKAIQCSEVLSNGIVVTGEEYTVEPLALPGPPEVTIAATDVTITLTWNTTLRCFESEMLTFVVIWSEIGSGTSTNVTTSSSPYTINRLQPGTSYQISVHGVGGSGVVGGMRVRIVKTTLAETPTGGGGPTAAIAIAAVVPVIILVAVVIVIILVAVRCWKTRVQRDYFTGSSAQDPIPPASSNPFSRRLSGTCYYTTVDLGSGNPTPIPPPPVEGVTYAEPVAVGEKESQTRDGETKPTLPPKQQPRHNIEKFRSDVVDALIAIGIDNVAAIETGGVPHFTAEYNDIHFVVTCVYTSSDVTYKDINLIIEAKEVTGSTKGLLISNQSTIPSEYLLTLEDAGCQFVPVGGYGEEGWEDRMIDKFKDVLPKEGNIDSESENLPTPVEETSPPPSCVIQPGTGPAPVQYNNSNNNNIKNKRWTVQLHHNNCSTSTFRGSEDEELTTIVKIESNALDNQNSEDLSTSEQVVNSSPMVPPKCPPLTIACPHPDYQDGYSGVTSDDNKVASYSHVGAKDVIKSFKWGELRKDIEDMLTKPRIDTLERGYNLIDSPCNAKIEAQLMNGDPAAAATTLLEYFERTHSADDLLQFCKFLRDEVKEVKSAKLKDLADRTESAVKNLQASQDPGKGKEERAAEEDSLNTEVKNSNPDTDHEPGTDPDTGPDEEIHRAISDAIEKGAVDVKIMKCVTMGPPEAGKTQLKRALLGDFTEADTSTPASTQATPAVEILVGGEKKWEHLDFEWLQAAVQKTASTRKFTERSIWEDVPFHPQPETNQEYSSEEPSDEENFLEKLREVPIYDVQNRDVQGQEFHHLKQEVMKIIPLSQSGDDGINIQEARLIYMVDSGGQPSFLDFHPVTATFAATYLLVYNMEEGLDAKPKMTYRKPKTYPTKILPDTTQSNLEIIRRSLLSLYHLKVRYRQMHEKLTKLMKHNFQQATYDPFTFIIGTRKKESICEEYKRRLTPEFHQIPSMKRVTKLSFVDSLTPNCKGIEQLRCSTCTDACLSSFRLPLSWFQLHLMCLAAESTEESNYRLGVQIYSELSTLCMEEKLVSSVVEFKAMVTLFHSLGVFSCPDLDLEENVEDSLVFTNPNLLFTYVTRILETPFRDLAEVFDKQSLTDLQSTGELTTSALEESDIPDTLGSYQGFHKRLLKWLVHWGLAAEMEQEGKWFIPSVLPPKPIAFHTSITENPFSPFPLSISFLQESTEDFTFHYLPEGFFPHFVVKLIKAGYTLPSNNPDHLEARIPRCRDAIFIIRRKEKFNAKIAFNISLIDEATHLSVHLYPPDRSAPNARQEAGAVLAELKLKMEETNESLYHRTNDRIAICCPCPCSSKEGRLRDQHIACVDPGEDGSIGITCLHPRRPQIGEWEERSTDELLNEVISGFHSKSDSSPSKSDLLKVLDIVPEWYNLAVALGVPVERVIKFQQIKTGGIDALCYWRCGEAGQNYPTCWRFLLNKIEECQGHNVARDVKKVFFPDSLMTDLKKTCGSSDPVTSTPKAHSFDVSDQLLGVITDTADFLLYTDKMTPHLTLLGTVLGIQDFATAIVNGPGDPQTKCLKILKQWMDVTPNPTWDLFCENLRKSPTFNNLRGRIAEDHDASGHS